MNLVFSFFYFFREGEVKYLNFKLWFSFFGDYSF